MANYVWTAKDKSGKTVVRQIPAATVEESKAMLLAEGCTDVTLVGDEIIAAAREAMAGKSEFLGQEVTITDEDRLRHRGKPVPTFASALWRGIVETKGFLALILLLVVVEIYRGHRVGLILLGLALVAWLGFLVCVRLPGIYYGRLHKAADWHRWTEVLDIVEKLKR